MAKKLKITANKVKPSAVPKARKVKVTKVASANAAYDGQDMIGANVNLSQQMSELEQAERVSAMRTRAKAMMQQSAMSDINEALDPNSYEAQVAANRKALGASKRKIKVKK